jgi:Protein of unknown function (DUF3592)
MPDSSLVWTLLFAGGVVLTVVTLFHGWQGARLLLSGTRTVGTLSRYTVEEHRQWQGEGRGSEDVRLDFPHVAFTLPDGTPVGFRSRLQHMFGPQRLVGSEVPVLYDLRDPAGTAEIAGGRAWFAVLFRVVPQTIVALALLYFAARAKGWLG